MGPLAQFQLGPALRKCDDPACQPIADEAAAGSLALRLGCASNPLGLEREVIADVEAEADRYDIALTDGDRDLIAKAVQRTVERLSPRPATRPA
jgi:hypothetical protein